MPCVQTTKLTKYKKTVGDVEIWIYDSPGYLTSIDDEELYLKDLQENCSEVDLNLYCVKMNDKILKSDKDTIVKLSNSFGKDEFWRNTLIVLTFANEVKSPARFGNFTPVDYFSKRMSECKMALHRVLTEDVQVTKEVVENIPIIPAGYSDEPSLPAANFDNWLKDLWFQCLDRTKDIGKPAPSREVEAGYFNKFW